MTAQFEIRFAPLSAAPQATALVLCANDLALGATARDLDQKSGGQIVRAAGAAQFTGKARKSIEILAPAKLDMQRLLVLGVGTEIGELDRLLLGGAALALIKSRPTETASIYLENLHGSQATTSEIAADFALGLQLRGYEFKKYQTKRAKTANGNGANGGANTGEGDADKSTELKTIVLHVAKPEQAAEAYRARAAIAEGVALARDLVNEPANALGPVEFAERVRDLGATGLDIEILDVPALEKLKMGALLGVAQGSARPARVAIMQWHGAKGKKTKPLCFVGKGVVFDTGGISMKPAAGMEDMKGDMAGAACVTGLMLALAKRKAPVNAVGLIGLVENMPSGNAMRPGDIVTSMSGQTIEVLNTDAEGRLVLADVLTYAQQRFKPRMIVNLATLTGAIMVALGKEFAGLFSNDDKLSEELAAAGRITGERVWRMPLDKAYDKLIDSKNADMKNIGGRFGGAITAAQFIQRYIDDTPWAHLDIAGTGMDSSRTDISQSWASGWGVRLLDRLVADSYERHEK
ncbi:MAG: leucyl aminopeptidase [Hyphomicrobiaceae bacterium]|nr:leucyl aminopeptidase [Hyphomicrobiaceae bacterium]